MTKPGWLLIADALIRSQLHMNPSYLEDEMWGHQLAMAEYTEARYFENMSKFLKF